MKVLNEITDKSREDFGNTSRFSQVKPAYYPFRTRAEKEAYLFAVNHAKSKGLKEYRFPDGFYMFGKDDEDTRIRVERKHKAWLKTKEVSK